VQLTTINFSTRLSCRMEILSTSYGDVISHRRRDTHSLQWQPIWKCNMNMMSTCCTKRPSFKMLVKTDGCCKHTRADIFCFFQFHNSGIQPWEHQYSEEGAEAQSGGKPEPQYERLTTETSITSQLAEEDILKVSGSDFDESNHFDHCIDVFFRMT